LKCACGFQSFPLSSARRIGIIRICGLCVFFPLPRVEGSGEGSRLPTRTHPHRPLAFIGTIVSIPPILRTGQAHRHAPFDLDF
jgi:hypothetical protein